MCGITTVKKYVIEYIFLKYRVKRILEKQYFFPTLSYKKITEIEIIR